MTAYQALSPRPDDPPGVRGHTDEPHQPFGVTVGWSVLFVACYLAIDASSAMLWSDPTPVRPWNPQAGLAVAAVCAGGMRYALPVFIAAWVSEVVLRSPSEAVAGQFVAALAITAALVGTGMVLRRRLFVRGLVSVAAVRDFLVIATGGAAFGALLYVGAFKLTQPATSAPFFSNLLHEWLGDLSGMIVVAPLALALMASKDRKGTPQPAAVWPDIAVFTVALGAVALLLSSVDTHASERLLYLLFVPLIVLAMRRGLPWAAFGVAMAQLVIVVTLWIAGDSADLVAHQMLMLVLGSTTLLLAAVAGERRLVLTELARRSAELSAQQHALSHAMRFSAASETAATLAHELSQPLSAIGTYARAGLEMLRRGVSTPAELSAVMERIASESGRTRESVQRIRDFFRTGTIRREPLLLASVVADVADSLRDRLRDGNISLTTQVEPSLPRLTADRLSLATVLHNLIGNAADAAADAPTPKWIRVIAKARGDTVEVDVSDSGAGIDPLLRDALFEPLTTTKAAGMGLGLSISRTLVNAHGGSLDLVASSPTTFRFSLPLHGTTAH